jgi:hypothetical protein
MSRHIQLGFDSRDRGLLELQAGQLDGGSHIGVVESTLAAGSGIHGPTQFQIFRLDRLQLLEHDGGSLEVEAVGLGLGRIVQVRLRVAGRKAGFERGLNRSVSRLEFHRQSFDRFTPELSTTPLCGALSGRIQLRAGE